MTPESVHQPAGIDAALTELQEAIRAQYPTASFAVTRGEDPEGTYLYATVDVEDTDAVVDVFIDRLLHFQGEEGLPLYVIPVRPAERIEAMLSQRGQRPSSHAHSLHPVISS
jgi:hypothetical protein